MTDNRLLEPEENWAGIKRGSAAGYADLRSDLTEEQKAEALRIGRLNYSSAGAVRRK